MQVGGKRLSFKALSARGVAVRTRKWRRRKEDLSLHDAISMGIREYLCASSYLKRW